MELRRANATQPSFLREKYDLFFGQLIDRLKIDQSILDYNYTRMNDYLQRLIAHQSHINYVRLHELKPIDDNEYPMALEFYLQFDRKRYGCIRSRCQLCLGYLFYMKTCSFRFARPRSLHEGVFCSQEPEARYELEACGNCGLCYPHYDRTHRSTPLVKFNQSHRHTFVNGYEAILNCSAVRRMIATPLASLSLSLSLSLDMSFSRAIRAMSSMH
jgi:hypothetical protein